MAQEMGSGGGDAGIKDGHHSDRSKKRRGKRGDERVRGGHGHQHQVAAANERRAAKRMKQASDTSADVAKHLRAEKELMLESMLRFSMGRCFTSQPAAERLCADEDVLEAVKQDCCTSTDASDMMPADMQPLHEDLKVAQSGDAARCASHLRSSMSTLELSQVAQQFTCMKHLRRRQRGNFHWLMHFLRRVAVAWLDSSR